VFSCVIYRKSHLYRANFKSDVSASRPVCDLTDLELVRRRIVRLPHSYCCFRVMFAAEVEKDIAALITSVPALDETFSIIDKIGAGVYIVN